MYFIRKNVIISFKKDQVSQLKIGRDGISIHFENVILKTNMLEIFTTVDSLCHSTSIAPKFAFDINL